MTRVKLGTERNPDASAATASQATDNGVRSHYPWLCRRFGHKLSGDPYSLANAFVAHCLRKGCSWDHRDHDGLRAALGRDR